MTYQQFIEGEKLNSYNDVGNRFIFRPLARPVAFWLSKTKITPTQITVISLLSGLLYLFFVIKDYRILAAFLICLELYLDIVDGQVARIKGQCTKFGGWFDGVVDRSMDFVMVFGVALAFYFQTGNSIGLILGLIVYFGLVMSSVVTVSIGDPNDEYLPYLNQTFKKLSQMPILKQLSSVGIQPQHLLILKGNRTILFAVAIIFNQLFLLLVFFAIVQNLYWLAAAVFKGVSI